MKLIWASGFAMLAILLATSAMSASAAPKGSPRLARGRYLVESVARCGDCHTPTDERGEPIPGKLLKGTTLPFKPTVPMPVWADKAPNIAGLPGWEDDAAIKFFMTGIAYNDLPARPPMPPYHLTMEDAEAVVAYLRSLAPAQK
jgi:mono/diheme cytochrome c family protein